MARQYKIGREIQQEGQNWSADVDQAPLRNIYRCDYQIPSVCFNITKVTECQTLNGCFSLQLTGDTDPYIPPKCPLLVALFETPP